MASVGKKVDIIFSQVSQSDYDKLKFFGVSEVEGHSWPVREQTLQGVTALLKECGFPADFLPECSELLFHTSAPCSTLSDYFYLLGSELSRLQQSKVNPNQTEDGSAQVLALNLLPLYLSPSRVDKIVSGLFDDISLLSTFDLVLILLRNVDWLVRSKAFKQLREDKITKDVWAIDIRCVGAKFSGSRPDVESFEISRAPFRAMLRADYDTVYRSLIYETNSFIGHFTLSNSHVRTHYDLTQFMRRDNIWEFLYTKLQAETEGYDRVLIIGAGMETAVISQVGEKLKALLDQKSSVYFLHSYGNPAEEVLRREQLPDFDLGIIVTDILNSGKTVEPFVKELAHIRREKPIKVFTVVRMLNSPRELKNAPIVHGVEIRREYYSRANCTLCKISQPEVKVNTAKDFHRVTWPQLTPFDFWEMVTDAKALERESRDAQGRSFYYRIDTARLISRYGGWLRNLLRDKFSENWGLVKPNALCTVGEDNSIAFAQLVGAALDVKHIFPVARENLARVTAAGGLPPGVKNPFPSEHNVLLVDDGMNYGHTMRRLIAFCRSANVTPMGIMVLDSRLNSRTANAIRLQIGYRPLIALYEWPASFERL